MAAQAFTALVGGDAAAAGSMSLFARIAPLDHAEATIWPMPWAGERRGCYHALDKVRATSGRLSATDPPFQDRNAGD